MKVKVFTKNKNDKIEFTEKELKELLDEVYWEGYRDNRTYTWTSPYYQYNYPSYGTGVEITCLHPSSISATDLKVNGTTKCVITSDPDYGNGMYA